MDSLDLNLYLVYFHKYIKRNRFRSFTLRLTLSVRMSNPRTLLLSSFSCCSRPQALCSLSNHPQAPKVPVKDREGRHGKFYTRREQGKTPLCSLTQDSMESNLIIPHLQRSLSPHSIFSRTKTKTLHPFNYSNAFHCYCLLVLLISKSNFILNLTPICIHKYIIMHTLTTIHTRKS